jgi:ADP-ribose pyrophosphatase YjhB (NUDIX family)
METSHPPTQIYCSLVVEKDGKILLVKEADPSVYGKWNQPAGHLEGTETPFECALREAKEETGYDVELTGLQSVYYRAAEGIYEINFCFKARPIGEAQSALAADVLETRWFSKDDVRSIPTEDFCHALAIRRIEDWLADKNFPVEALAGYPKDHKDL